jgi:hypothetical protein
MAARRVSVIQSNYIPWKGYFDLMAASDQFVLYDIVQFTKNDWRNRNVIKTAGGPLWLTIPVAHSGRFGQRVDQVVATDGRWRQKHWRSIAQAYAKAEHFATYADRFEALYLGSEERRLSAINAAFIAVLADGLGIRTPVASAGDLELPEDRIDRLIAICRHFDAGEYVSGPAARAYLDESRFAAAGIDVTFMDYDRYPEYPQLHPPFEHKVSALDLLFNTGPDARSFMLAGR